MSTNLKFYTILIAYINVETWKKQYHKLRCNNFDTFISLLLIKVFSNKFLSFLAKCAAKDIKLK